MDLTPGGTSTLWVTVTGPSLCSQVRRLDPEGSGGSSTCPDSPLTKVRRYGSEIFVKEI